MKKSALIGLLVVTVMSGCTARARRNTTFVTGALVTSAGASLLTLLALGEILPPLPRYSGGSCGACNEPAQAEQESSSGKSLAITGVLLTVAGGAVLGIGALQLSEENEQKRALRNAQLLEQQSDLSARQRDRERAWTSMKAAVLAANNGDCLQVKNASPRVQALDAELHRTVFLANAQIAECLGVPAYVPPPPPRDPKEDRARAFAITWATAKAARGGHCADALAAEKKVRELDPNVYAGWFAPDEAIKRCLEPDAALEPAAASDLAPSAP